MPAHGIHLARNPPHVPKLPAAKRPDARPPDGETGVTSTGGCGARRRRTFEDWLLLLLSAEKSVQHVFVTWAFASDRFDLRGDVTPPWQVLLVIGGISAALFALALVGLWRWRAWAPDLLIPLALVDIVGEFIAQGTLMIHVVLSFVVAWLVLVLAWRARPRYRSVSTPPA